MPPLVKRITKLVTNQWQIKLMLFGLAVLLWFFVVFNDKYETTVRIPLVPVEVKPKKIIVSELPSEVEVRVSGKGMDLIVMKYIKKAHLELDLHTINYFFDYPIRPHFAKIPQGLSVEPIEIVDPDTVKVRLEDLVTSRIPIVPQVEVNPSPGYVMVGQVTTLPDSATLSGPRSIIRTISQITTKELTISSVEKSGNRPLDLILPDQNYFRVLPPRVQVLYDIDKLADRKIDQIPIRTVNVPRGRNALIEPSKLSVVVRGPSGKLAELKVDDIDAFVNLRRWNSRKKNYEPEFRLPGGLELIKSIPSEVRIRLEVNL